MTHKCTHCGEWFTDRELAEGWCETCGATMAGVALPAATADAAPLRSEATQSSTDAARTKGDSFRPPNRPDYRCLAADLLSMGAPPAEVESQLFEKGLDARAADRLVKEMLNAPKPPGHYLPLARRWLLALGGLLLSVLGFLAHATFMAGLHPLIFVGPILEALACVCWIAALWRRAPSGFWLSVGGGWWYLRRPDGTVLVWNEEWRGDKERNCRVLPSAPTLSMSRLRRHELRGWLDGNVRV